MNRLQIGLAYKLFSLILIYEAWSTHTEYMHLHEHVEYTQYMHRVV